MLGGINISFQQFAHMKDENGECQNGDDKRMC